MPKKLINLVLIFLIIVNIPFILYLSNFKLLLSDESYYKEEFQKYDVYSALKEHDIEQINRDVLDYFENEDELIRNDFFNEKEKSHLLDVKKLIDDIFYLFKLLLMNFLVLSILLYFLNKNKFMKYLGFSLASGGILTFLHAFFFWLAIKLNFDKTFTLFHKIFFEGNWMFNPLTNKIVILYPQGFFFDFAFDIVIRTLILAFVLILVGMVLFLKFKKK